MSRSGWRSRIQTGKRRLRESLEAAGLRCVRGGRFLHVTGAADKGTAVTVLAHSTGASTKTWSRSGSATG